MTASNAIMPLESFEGCVDTDAPAAKVFEPWLVVVTDVTAFVSVLAEDGAGMDLRTNAFERQERTKVSNCACERRNVDSDLAEIVGNIAGAVCMSIMIPTNLLSFKV